MQADNAPTSPTAVLAPAAVATSAWDRRLRATALALAAAVLLGLGAALGGLLVGAQTYDAGEYAAARQAALDEGYRSGYDAGYAAGAAAEADADAQEPGPSWWERLFGG
jgi:hypothetical protein